MPSFSQSAESLWKRIIEIDFSDGSRLIEGFRIDLHGVDHIMKPTQPVWEIPSELRYSYGGVSIVPFDGLVEDTLLEDGELSGVYLVSQMDQDTFTSVVAEEQDGK